jgi:hypothetical protein
VKWDRRGFTAETQRTRRDGGADLLPPARKAFPGDSRRKAQLSGKTAELTPLGRKLLRVDL